MIRRESKKIYELMYLQVKSNKILLILCKTNLVTTGSCETQEVKRQKTIAILQFKSLDLHRHK